MAQRPSMQQPVDMVGKDESHDQGTTQFPNRSIRCSLEADNSWHSMRWSRQWRSQQRGTA